MDALVFFLIDNFWLILLISVMIYNRSHRPNGILLLVIQTVFGFIPWIVFVIGLLSLGIAGIQWYMSYREESKHPHKQPRRDPDYEW